MKRNHIWVVEYQERPGLWIETMPAFIMRSNADREAKRCNYIEHGNYRVVKYEAVGKGETR